MICVLLRAVSKPSSSVNTGIRGLYGDGSIYCLKASCETDFEIVQTSVTKIVEGYEQAFLYNVCKHLLISNTKITKLTTKCN